MNFGGLKGIYMEIGFCLLAILFYGIVTFILPLAAIAGLVFVIIKLFKKPGKSGGGGRPVRSEAELAAEAAMANVIEEAESMEAIARRKRHELAEAMKAKGRLDRLALVYYIESALKSGLDRAAIAAALKAKGWPDPEVESAFSSYSGLA